MSRQIEFANDLRAQQRNDVRTDGKFEAGKDFFGYRGASQHVTTFEHQHALAGTREIRCIHEAVVAAADDDTIVFVIHTGDLTHPLTKVVLTRACLMKIGYDTYNHSR